MKLTKILTGITLGSIMLCGAAYAADGSQLTVESFKGSAGGQACFQITQLPNDIKATPIGKNVLGCETLKHGRPQDAATTMFEKSDGTSVATIDGVNMALLVGGSHMGNIAINNGNAVFTPDMGVDIDVYQNTGANTGVSLAVMNYKDSHNHGHDAPKGWKLINK